MGKDGDYWVPLSVKPTKQSPSEEVFRLFNGVVRRVDGKGFGFVGDVFIPPILLKGLPESQDSVVLGKATLSFDKMKKGFSWKAIDLAQK